jgi:hypothetical protein
LALLTLLRAWLRTQQRVCASQKKTSKAAMPCNHMHAQPGKHTAFFALLCFATRFGLCHALHVPCTLISPKLANYGVFAVKAVDPLQRTVEISQCRCHR